MIIIMIQKFVYLDSTMMQYKKLYDYNNKIHMHNQRNHRATRAN